MREAEGWKDLGAVITVRVREVAGEKGYERANGRLLHYLHLLDRVLQAEINVLVGPALLTWPAVLSASYLPD